MVEIRITNKLQGVQKLRLVTISTGKTNENSHFAWCNASVFNAPYMTENTDYYLHTLKAPTAVPNLPYKSTVTYLSDLDYTGTTSGGIEFDISLTATGKTGQTQTSNHSVTLSH